MRRDQLEHAIRTACQIIGRPEVIVVGSPSIPWHVPRGSMACRSHGVDRGRHPADRGWQRGDSAPGRPSRGRHADISGSHGCRPTSPCVNLSIRNATSATKGNGMAYGGSGRRPAPPHGGADREGEALGVSSAAASPGRPAHHEAQRVVTTLDCCVVGKHCIADLDCPDFRQRRCIYAETNWQVLVVR
jgi:hypothetical protein